MTGLVKTWIGECLTGATGGDFGKMALSYIFLVTKCTIVMGMVEKSVSGERPSCFYISSHPALRDDQRE